MKLHIKEARVQAGLSQKDLARMIGVAPSTFNGYESGNHDPKSDLLIKIAKACNVSVDFLLGHDAVVDTKKSSVCWTLGSANVSSASYTALGCLHLLSSSLNRSLLLCSTF